MSNTPLIMFLVFIAITWALRTGPRSGRPGRARISRPAGRSTAGKTGSRWRAII